MNSPAPLPSSVYPTQFFNDGFCEIPQHTPLEITGSPSLPDIIPPVIAEFEAIELTATVVIVYLRFACPSTQRIEYA